MLKVGQLLERAVLLTIVRVGGYSEAGARPKILSETILVRHMLLLELHSEIIVPIIRGGAVGDSTTYSLLREKLSAVLKLRRLLRVSLRSS